MKNSLIKKYENQKALTGIVGLGYVGLPLALAFSEANLKVIGFDIDKEKVDLINKGDSYFKHISRNSIMSSVNNGYLTATNDFAQIGHLDVIILCLPTPLKKNREPDLSFIINTMEKILPFTKKGQALCLESTTYPGTTEEELLTRLTDWGYRVGEDFFLIYSPEREDPGNLQFITKKIPKVVGGTTKNCLEVGKSIYESVTEYVVPVSSTKVAELTKLLENIYRAVNIGLVNEMKIVADKMNIDIWEVINAAATKPFGFTPFYPGPGWGGHCIPIDPFYLTWKAKEYGINTKFIELSGEINTEMPLWVYQKVVAGLNEKKKPVKESQILVLGLSYKKNIDDIRESPSVKIMEMLKKGGAKVFYSDPFIPKFPRMREHYFDLSSIEISEECLKSMDCIIISTNHDAFDYDLILKHSDLIIDTRGVYNDKYVNVIKA